MDSSALTWGPTTQPSSHLWGLPEPARPTLTDPHDCRFVGRPGDYVYIFRSFRMEEVGPTLLPHLGSHSTPQFSAHKAPALLSSCWGGLRSSMACPYSVSLKGESLFRVMETKKITPIFLFFFFCKTLNVFLFG